jgi:hemerythrin superfamily protein
VQLHFTEEENEIFPQVTNLKKDRDLDRLAEQLATNKKEYQRTAPLVSPQTVGITLQHFGFSFALPDRDPIDRNIIPHGY